jgi:hypothetical protein
MQSHRHTDTDTHTHTQFIGIPLLSFILTIHHYILPYHISFYHLLLQPLTL